MGMLNPLTIGFSSKTLIRSLDQPMDYMLHLDATFKLNKRGFPVIVIGISDMRRQFHPVSVYIVSDVKKGRWASAVQSTLDMFCTITGHMLTNLKYVMMDADDAQRNACEEILAKTLAEQPISTMYFFHVMQNVRKRTSHMTACTKRQVYRHVYRIHYSRQAEDYETRVGDATSYWEQNQDDQIASFGEYFKRQWLTGRFNLWSCHVSGVAKTNNPVEQFNRDFKLTTLSVDFCL